MGINTVLFLRAIAGVGRAAVTATQQHSAEQHRGKRRKGKEPCTPCAAKAEVRYHQAQARTFKR